MSARKFERAFTGRANAGLRSRIAKAVNGAWCGNENARLVLGLAKVIALQPSGLATLKTVAEDYRAVGGDYKASCDCVACTAGTRQQMGANG